MNYLLYSILYILYHKGNIMTHKHSYTCHIHTLLYIYVICRMPQSTPDASKLHIGH